MAIDTTATLSRAAFRDRPIALPDCAGFEQAAQFRQRFAVPAKNKAAGRIPIEAMSKRRRARQSETKRIEIVLQAFAALGPFMNREPGRLVDYQHQRIAIEHARDYLFRHHRRAGITSAT